jgi:hypothetical protein
MGRPPVGRTSDRMERTRFRTFESRHAATNRDQLSPSRRNPPLRRKFAAQSACDRADGTPEAEARQDQITAEALAMVATRGLKFDLTPADRQRLEAGGLSPSEVNEIHPTLAGLVEVGLLPTLRLEVSGRVATGDRRSGLRGHRGVGYVEGKIGERA